MIATEIDRFQPDEVLVASGMDWHPDHRACSAAVRRAVAGGSGEPSRVLEYPVWFWMHGPWRADEGGPWAARRALSFASGLLATLRRPTTELVATRGHLAAKARPLRSHRSQLSNLTGEAEWPVLDERFVASFLMTHEVSFPFYGTHGGRRYGPEQHHG